MSKSPPFKNTCGFFPFKRSCVKACTKETEMERRQKEAHGGIEGNQTMKEKAWRPGIRFTCSELCVNVQ